MSQYTCNLGACRRHKQERAPERNGIAQDCLGQYDRDSAQYTLNLKAVLNSRNPVPRRIYKVRSPITGPWDTIVRDPDLSFNTHDTSVSVTLEQDDLKTSSYIHATFPKAPAQSVCRSTRGGSAR
ncbi:hypothetical protein Dda_6059 [Drechslerella dactyloides]|uniref:Uncharacterized protein n=1 Tax=Drechslerella dactyloides TaxID=74499 RepID=A0AAD6IVF8_DREDA|nr:hypothetical protein Dda_6059 [Drechslerella dactyloides]